MKIYISGRIKGNSTARKDFANAAMQLKMMGHEPINPFEVAPNPRTYQWALKMDIQALLECDAILLLDNWEQSYGARVEQHVAEAIGLFELSEDYLALPRG